MEAVSYTHLDVYKRQVMTQPGETDGYGAFEHVQALIQQAGTQFLDYVIVNDPVSYTHLDVYKRQNYY